MLRWFISCLLGRVVIVSVCSSVGFMIIVYVSVAVTVFVFLEGCSVFLRVRVADLRFLVVAVTVFGFLCVIEV